MGSMSDEQEASRSLTAPWSKIELWHYSREKIVEFDSLRLACDHLLKTRNPNLVIVCYDKEGLPAQSYTLDSFGA